MAKKLEYNTLYNTNAQLMGVHKMQLGEASPHKMCSAQSDNHFIK